MIIKKNIFIAKSQCIVKCNLRKYCPIPDNFLKIPAREHIILENVIASNYCPNYNNT